jgi:hypothetical protein
MKTKNNFRKANMLVSMFIAIGCFVFASATTFAQKANFTGNYTFNETKSVVGQGRFRVSSKLAVTQDANTLNIERTSKGRNGEDQVMKEKITLDGKECENIVFQDRTRKSTATWSADEKTLTIKSSMTFERNGEKTEMKSSEVWTISVDGNTLTLESTSTSPMGENKQTLVYEKAK